MQGAQLWWQPVNRAVRCSGRWEGSSRGRDMLKLWLTQVDVSNKKTNKKKNEGYRAG